MTTALDRDHTPAESAPRRQRFRLVAISGGQLTAWYLAATLLAAPSGIWLGRQLDKRNIATVIRTVGAGLAVALGIAAASPAL